MSEEIKDMIGVATAVGSRAAAVAGLGIAVWIANTQRRLQERQIQQDLFDKRFAVYTSVEEFLMCILRANGKFEMSDFSRFLFVVERAEFLFGPDVNDYIHAIREKVNRLYPKAVERQQKSEMREDVSAISSEITKILEDLSGPTLEKRREIFKPYLQLYRS